MSVSIVYAHFAFGNFKREASIGLINQAKQPLVAKRLIPSYNKKTGNLIVSIIVDMETYKYGYNQLYYVNGPFPIK